MMPPAEARRRRLEMVENQLEARGISDTRVLQAMRTVPREHFVAPGDEPLAYVDGALPIGYGQTISQPYMVALMCELLQVKPEHRVLEIGAGSGYQAAILGQLAAQVYAIEIVPQLVQRAKGVISRLGYTNVHILAGNGSVGYPLDAPYDRIIVAAAAPAIPPPLVEQLVEGGRIVAPVGSRGTQSCLVATKRAGVLVYESGIACVFVPLVGEHGWPAP
jgi:protein-L-isoaspartate(D-aspartate) O-methyltransferase